MVICKFDSKLHCVDILKKCLKCPYMGNQTTLDQTRNPTKATNYVCPFCLYSGKLKDFYAFNMKKKIEKTKQCPNCKNRMMEYTLFLIGSLTPSELALWIYQYPSRDFWSKCRFNDFKENLYKKGVSNEFWDNYIE